MELVLRSCFVYFVLMALFRLAGKRTLSQITTFDLVLTLIISEAVQGALTDGNNSLTGAVLIIVTLIGLDVLLSWVKLRWPRTELWLDGSPVVVVEDGRLLRDRMRAERIDETDILEAARELQGLSRLDQIRYAIVERGGKITIIPREA